MIVENVREKVGEMVNYAENQIKTNYKKYKGEDDSIFSQVNGQELSQLILSKTVLDNIYSCLDPNTKVYNCFIPIEPILDKYYPNKKDWLPVFGLLLAKAKKVENDYKILTNYLEKVDQVKFGAHVDSINLSIKNDFVNSSDKESLKNTLFLNKIINEKGEFLPYILTNYDRFMLQAMGMSFDQVAIISKHCRSLYKQEQLKKEEKEVLKGTRVVNLEKVNEDIKAQKSKLEYLKGFLSLDNYEIVSLDPISIEVANSIITTLEDLSFSKDKIELVKTRIIKYNEQLKNNEHLKQIEELKKELFTNEMFGLYEDAKSTVVDNNVVYKNIKEQLVERLSLIDSILNDYINGKETKDNTCEYLVMAFEDLHQSLKLCGPRLVRA